MGGKIDSAGQAPHDQITSGWKMAVVISGFVFVHREEVERRCLFFIFYFLIFCSCGSGALQLLTTK